jgi:2-methoxy-6-polyprenyl-1,4-benzoquinol methylase
MLNVGMQRASNLKLNSRINWRQGNAENLVLEKENTYDVYTIAFGIRNCTNIDKVVREAYRVLKPGGRFMCLEFSHANNEIFSK